jgi:dinuclear metal center YbgI/SA1388 family protein
VPLFLCPVLIVTTVQDIVDILQDIAATELAQPWDNVGLLIGSPASRLSSILLALDPTSELVAQAQSLGAELIITHHPAIFHPLKTLRTDTPTGGFINAALQAGISVAGCHTNLDAARGGVNDVLAEALQLTGVSPLLPAENHNQDSGLGRVGDLVQPLSCKDFLHRLEKAIEPPWLLEAGSRPEIIRRVAVAGGSCSDFSEKALSAGADVYVTSEVKHDIARWVEEAGLWLIDAGHFATENPAMPALGQLLADRLQQQNMAVAIHIGKQEPPLKLVGQ